MYHHFPAKEKILTSKRCINIESNANSVKVTTADGSVYNGDIVIGADGVHSTVRKSMWNLMEQKNPGSSKASKEGSSLSIF
jgi:2-polyprenyl-6-methoxyphenol hydroxylase-like FAD-dependent oxidoreductase